MYDDASLYLGEIIILDNNMTSAQASAILFEVYEYIGYDMYERSYFEIGRIVIENNVMNTATDGVEFYYYEYIGEYLYDDSEFYIGDIVIRGNDIVAVGRAIEYYIDDYFGQDNAQSSLFEVGEVIIDDNELVSSNYPIYFHYYGVGYYNFDNSVVSLDGITITDNDIWAPSSTGIYIDYSDYNGVNLEDYAILDLGDILIQGNEINSSSTAIYIISYDIGYANYDSSQVFMGEISILDNNITAQNNAISIYMDDCGYELELWCNLTFDGINIIRNNIWANGYGFYYELYDEVGYDFYDHASMYIGDIHIQDNYMNTTSECVYFYYEYVACELYGNSSFYLGDVHVINNTFISDDSGFYIYYYDYYVGSYCYDDVQVTLSNYTFLNNTFDVDDDGIYFYTYSNPDDNYGRTNVDFGGFLIDNNSFSGYYGVYLYYDDVTETGYEYSTAHAGDIMITNNTFKDMEENAIYVYLDEFGYYNYEYTLVTLGDVVISNNVIDNVGGIGIEVYHYQNVYQYGVLDVGDFYIENNEISNCDSEGIYFYHDLEVEDDSVMEVGNTTIKNNTIKNCGQDGIYYEIYLDTSDNGKITFGESFIQNNTVENCTTSGIYAYLSLSESSSIPVTLGDMIFSNNTIREIKSYGLYLDNIINALVDNNTISDCTDEAIYLTGCTDLVLHHNYMFDNNLSGGFSAYDDGTTNIWDDGSRGNYWSEYPLYYPTATSDGFIWSIPYDVRGGGGFQDRYPLSDHPFDFPTSHAPFRIDKDADFLTSTAVSNPGAAGTAVDPYLIENLLINGTGVGFGIYIGNTTKHYEIRNCTVRSADGYSNEYYWNAGIALQNTTNGTVKNCTVNRNEYGIYANASSGLTIIENTMYLNSDSCIYYQVNPDEADGDMTLLDMIIEDNYLNVTNGDYGIEYSIYLDYNYISGYDVMIVDISICGNCIEMNGTSASGIDIDEIDIYYMVDGNVTVGDIDISSNQIFGGGSGIYLDEYGFYDYDNVPITCGDFSVDENTFMGQSNYGAYLAYPYWFEYIYGDVSMTFGDVSASGNTMTDVDKGLYVYGLAYMCDQYDASVAVVGDVFVNDNDVYSTNDAIHIETQTTAYDSAYDSILVIGDIYCENNSVVSDSGKGIYFEYYEVGYYQLDSAELIMGNITLANNNVTSDSYGIHFYYYEVAYGSEDETSAVMGETRIYGNDVNADSTGIYIEFSDYVGYELLDNSTFELGEYIITDNNINTTYEGIYFEFYDVGYSLENNSTVLFDGFSIRDNVFDSSYGIYFEYYDCGEYLYDNSSMIFGETWISNNYIVSSSEAIYFDLYDLGYDLNDNSSVTLDKITIIDNEIFSGDDGIEVYMSVVGYDMYNQSKFTIGGFDVVGNNLTADGYGFSLDLYDYVAYEMYGWSNFTFGEMAIRGNTFNTTDDTIYMIYCSSGSDETQSYMYEDSSYYQEDITITNNDILSEDDGIYVEYYEYYVGYELYDDVYVRMPGFLITDNTIDSDNECFYILSGENPSDIYDRARFDYGEILFDSNTCSGTYGVDVEYYEFGYSDVDDDIVINVGDITVTDNDFIDMTYYGVYIYVYDLIYDADGDAFLNFGDVDISGNTVENAQTGIYIDWDSMYSLSTANVTFGDMTIYDNTLTNLTNYGMYVYYHTYVEDTSNMTLGETYIGYNTIDNCSMDGIHIITDNQVVGTASSILGNATIEYNVITNCSESGIEFDTTPNSFYGTLGNLGNASIEFNTIDNCSIGIELQDPRNTTISDNVISKCGVGIRMDEGENNTLLGNVISGGIEGIHFSNGSYSMLKDNMVINAQLSLNLSLSDNLTIYNNYFDSVNNYFVDTNENITWNITKTPGVSIIGGTNLGGNYWSDYIGKDTDGDWLGNTLLPYGPGDLLPLAYDTVVPELDDTTTGSPTTGDPYVVTVDVTDERAVDEVWIEYWFGSGGHTNVSMTNSGGDTWTYTISVPYTSLDKLSYIIHANDTSDNWNSSSNLGITVYDNDGPEFVDLTTSPGYTGEIHNLTVDVTDNILLDSVYVEYWFGSGGHTNVSMDVGTGDNFYYVVNVPQSLDSLHYIFHANDSYDNWNESSGTVVIMDDEIPVYLNDLTAGTATTGDSFTFSVDVWDNIAVDKVFVEYWYGAGLHTNASMTKGIGNNYFLAITIPHSLSTLHYIFHANDTSDQWNETAQGDVTVLDNDAPTYVDNGPGTPTTGDKHTFNVTLGDNIAVANGYVLYWTDTVGPANSTLVAVGGGYYEFTMSIPSDATMLYYIISVVDTSGNWANSAQISVAVGDNDPPVIVDNSPISGTTGDSYTFNVSVTDNIGATGVYVQYWTDVTTALNVSMVAMGGGYYELTVSLPASATVLYYNISAMDAGLNWVETGTLSAVVTDNDPPAITDNGPFTATTGDAYTFNFTVTDNIAVAGVYVLYWTYGGNVVNATCVNVGGNFYELSIVLPSNATDLYYIVSAVDTSGNWVALTQVDVVVGDNDGPVVADNSPATGTTGDSYTFNVTVTDNIGMGTVYVYYWTDVTGATNATAVSMGGMYYEVSITLPASATMLYYDISAQDAAGNWAGLATLTAVVLDNDPAAIVDNGPYTATTGDAYTFNVTVTDNLGVANVYVLYWTYGGDVVNSTCVNVGGNYYELSIVLPSNATALHYVVSAVDTSGNWADLAQVDVVVGDNDGPLVADNSPASGTTGDSYTFNVTVTDNIGMGTVYVYYWTDVTGATNATAVHMGGMYYEVSITLPASATMLYWDISAQDAAGNWAGLSTLSAIVLDNDPAAIVDNGPYTATTGDPYTFNLTVTDNIGVGSVHVLYWTYAGNAVNATLVNIGGWYLVTVMIPANATDLHYIVSSVDTSGNWADLAQVDVVVLDNDAAMIVDNSPAFGTTGDDHTFTTSVLDNIGMGTVYVNYWTDVSGPNNFTMTDVGGAIYQYTFTLPDSATMLYYEMSAVDAAGNWAMIGSLSAFVLDNDAPMLNDTTPADPATGDEFTFTVNVTDNIGVGNVYVLYWTDVSTPANMTMALSGNYSLMITVPPGASMLHYIISAVDSAGNWASLNQTNLTVLDNKAPWSIVDLSPLMSYTGLNYTFNATVMDNIGVNEVYVVYWTDVSGSANETTALTGGFYTFTATIPVSATMLYYKFVAVDASGNWAESPVFTRSVMDIIPPVVTDESPSVAYTDSSFIFKANASDNIGVTTVYVIYSINARPLVQAKMLAGYEFTLLLPADATTLSYRFNATDGAGNYMTSAWTVIPVTDNIPPGLLDLTEDSGTTGDEFQFRFTVSDNIGIRTVKITYWFGSANASAVTVNATELNGFYIYNMTLPLNSIATLRYTVAVADLASNVLATDLENVTVRDNDAPKAVIVVSGKLSVDQEIGFSGAGSTDNINVVNHTWMFNDAGVDVVLYGPEVSYTFTTPGFVTMALTVRDAAGNSNTETVTIEIEGDDTPVVVDTTDSDNDTLLDSWEIEYFGDLGNGPDDDPDNDNYTNRQEYERKTNPMVANVAPGDDDTDDDVVDDDDTGGGSGGDTTSSSSSTFYLILLLLIVALVVIVVLAYLLKSRSKPSGEEEEPEEVDEEEMEEEEEEEEEPEDVDDLEDEEPDIEDEEDPDIEDEEDPDIEDEEEPDMDEPEDVYDAVEAEEEP